MANLKIGSHPSHDLEVAEKITEAKQLTWNDSGKLFFVEQGSGSYVVNLPKLSTEIAGWQGKFILTKLGDAVEINGYGITAPNTPATAEDLEKMFYVDFTHATYEEDNTVDGVSFGASAATLGCIIDIHTDGSNWFVMGHGDIANDIVKVG